MVMLTAYKKLVNVGDPNWCLLTVESLFVSSVVNHGIAVGIVVDVAVGIAVDF